MHELDLRYIVRSMGDLCGIPIRIFEDGELTCYHSNILLPKDPMTVYNKEIFASTKHVDYFITPRFLYYGIVNFGDLRIVVGPTSQVPPSDRSLRELAFQADVSKEDVPAFLEGMKAIVRMPLESILVMLCNVNYVLSGEKLELRDLTIQEAEQNALKEQVERYRTRNKFDAAIEIEPHNTFQLEETLMDIVRKGDTAALKRWAGQAPAIRGGVIAADQLRQLKNMFIVSATLASRAAIRGGMDVDTAFTLSDSYIQRVEYLSTQGDILNLQYNMLMEFTEQVGHVRRGGQATKLAIDVANYIQRHLSEPISAEALAKEFYLSRTHFSAKFKKETGETLTDFILKEKTEEAKRLLRYSDKTVSQISGYLGFSSHGHLSRVFKKYVGLTPNEYREKHSR